MRLTIKDEDDQSYTDESEESDEENEEGGMHG